MEIDFRFTALSILAGYALVATLERVRSLRLRESAFLRPFFATDVLWYLAAIAVTLAFGPLLEGLARARAAIGLPGLESLQLSWVAQVGVATLLYDVGATATHRILHRYDALWRLHKVHHSSRVLDWLATTRAHALEHLFRGIPTQAALFAMGVPASALAVALAIYAAFATLGHSNLRIDLSALEWLFVTPRIHHLHHVPETTHCNFGTIFTLWDRASGRLVVKVASADEVLGVPGEVEGYPQTWWRQLVEPFRG
jgi:sterol desaturase/sphingolipid hydroxylase (fatty acid hydroxylase superfamily)